MHAIRRNIFYPVVCLFAVSGWLWIWVAAHGPVESHFTVCLFKNLTGIPCPSCGMTRSLGFIAEGHWEDALRMNPLGFIAAFGIIMLPLWLIRDLLGRSFSLYDTFYTLETRMKKKPVIIGLILILITINWLWNIYKQV